MIVFAVSKEQRAEAFALLAAASLPSNDIDDKVELFALQTEDGLTGTIGWETDGTTALLRSLSVRKDCQRKGYGNALINYLEARARQKAVRSLYLLTTTAAAFFSKHGYIVIRRAEAPAFIQQTTEFKSLCPASATVMKKELA